MLELHYNENLNIHHRVSSRPKTKTNADELIISNIACQDGNVETLDSGPLPIHKLSNQSEFSCLFIVHSISKFRF